MAQRALLIDTDILVLLGASGTLADIIGLLGFSSAEVRRLPAAVSQLERGKRFKGTYSGAALQAALRVAGTIAPLTRRETDSALIEPLAGINGIDETDAVLLALLAEHDGYFLTTGDKRALIAAATAPTLADLRTRIKGRAICLESLLKLLVRKLGAKAAAAAFAGVMTHRTVGVLLTETQVQSDDTCLRGIESYLSDLTRVTGEGFLYLP